MGFELNGTGVGDIKASGLAEFSCKAGSVTTMDTGDIRFGGEYQEFIGCHLKDFLSKRSTFKLTVGTNSSRILLIKGAKAGGLEVGT